MAWPTSVATDAELYLAVNNLSTVLTDNPLTAGATTVNVSDASSFPTVGILTIDLEAIHYTGTTATSFTGCTRGFDGTTGASHAVSATVFHDIPAAHHNDLKDEIIAIETSLAATLGLTPAAYTINRALESDGSGVIAASAVTSTELGYVSGVTSAIQTQFGSKADDSLVVHLAGAETITGAKAFSTEVTFPAGASATPSINFTGTSQTGLSARATNVLTASCNAIIQQEWFDSFSAFNGTHVRFPAGTEAAPAITYTGQTGDGWRSIGAANIGLSLGGSDAVDYATSTVTFTPSITATGGIVDLLAYRRPNLVYASATTVTVESGLNGTSGDVVVMFPDGTVRTTNNTTLTTFNITQNAVLSGSKQSGLRTSLSEATDTWYALYAVKATDSSDIVTVGDTVLPLQANFATLNSNFGTDDWVYLGLIRNGDASTATGDILEFEQSNGMTVFRNDATGTAENGAGILLADSAATTALTYTYAAGTGTLQIPNHVRLVSFQFSSNIGATAVGIILRDSASTRPYYLREDTAGNITKILPLTQSNDGLNFGLGSSKNASIYLRNFVDSVLAPGSNPLL